MRITKYPVTDEDKQNKYVPLEIGLEEGKRRGMDQ